MADLGDLAAADGAQAVGAHGQDAFAFEKNIAIGKLGGRDREEPGEGEGGHAFAAAAFAHDGEGGALFEREGDVFYGIDRAVFGAEADGEIADFEQVDHDYFLSERVSAAWRRASPAR